MALSLSQLLRLSLHAAAALVAVAVLAPAEIRVWVDERGVLHASNADAPASAVAAGDARGLWGEERIGAPLARERGATSSEDDRLFRIVREALVDLQRGDTTLAVGRLHEVLRRDASRPEAHFYLALIEGRRGNLDAAEAHLRAFSSVAGEGYDGWRASAQRRLTQLDDERRLAALQQGAPLRLVPLRHADFVVEADSALLAAGGAAFEATVARILDDARAHVGGVLGVAPPQALGVRLYGRANYARTHAHRFSFQTVGFFDGSIHVVSAAHPGGELRGLIVHEYTHALFKLQTGGDSPFWLNEGLAELLERRALARLPLSRAEETQLRAALADESWLPLRRIAASFSGLSDKEARLAYAISTATADWLVRHTVAPARATLLGSLGRGANLDDALRAACGLDTEGIDAAVRRELVAGRVAAAD